MLTLEVLYAVLQGLPPDKFTHLNKYWSSFCWKIHEALRQGQQPLAAVRSALDDLVGYNLLHLRLLLEHVQPVMDLPKLSYRQKEALIALRYAKVASLGELSAALIQDRSNTHRRMKVLCERGYVLKFFSKGGVHYYALPNPLDHSVKVQVTTFCANAWLNSQIPPRNRSSTISTTPTTR